MDVKLKDFTRNGKEENRGPHAKELGAVVSARARLISASKEEKDDDDDHHCSLEDHHLRFQVTQASVMRFEKEQR